MVDPIEQVEQTKGDDLNRLPEGIGTPVEYDRVWIGSFLRPLLIALLAACIATALLAFIRISITPLPAIYTRLMLLVSIGASLLGSFSTTWLAQPEQRTQRNSGIRGAELTLLLLLVRLIGWGALGGWPTANEFFTRPLDTLLDGPFILGFIVIAIAWGISTIMTGELLSMGLQPDEIAALQKKQSRHELDQTPPNYTDRRAVLNSFVNRWMMGGLLLVLFSAGSRLAPAQNGFFALTKQQIDPTVIAAIVIYFLAGLLLISSGQLALLRARWSLEKVASQESVLRNWPTYALLLILGVALLAMLLPFGGTFYLAQILSTILRFFYIAMLTLVQIFFGLLAALFSLAGGEGNASPAPPPLPEIDFSTLVDDPPVGGGVPPWLGGSIFWGITLLLLGYAATIYFSGRGLKLSWFQQLWQLLLARWSELFGSYQTWRTTKAAQTVSTDASGNRSLLDRAGSWLRLRNLAPHQQVRYFYLTTLQRAERAGLPRHRGETPLQYAPRLAQKLDDDLKAEGVDAAAETAPDSAPPDAKLLGTKNVPETDSAQRENAQAVQALTDAFVRVRYAAHTPQPEQIPALKRLWQRLKRRLRSG